MRQLNREMPHRLGREHILSSRIADFLRRETFLLALTPALGVFCLYRYEAGRYLFLGIDSDLIDLPMSRVVLAATALILIAVLWVFLASVIRDLFNQQGRFKKYRSFLGTFLLWFLMFGWSLFMLDPTALGLGRSLFACLLLSGVGLDSPSSKSSAAVAERPEKSSFRGDLVGFTIMSLLFMLLVYSAGYYLERMSLQRTCIASRPNSFIVGRSGDGFLIKKYDPKLHALEEGFSIEPLDRGLNLATCHTGSLIGFEVMKPTLLGVQSKE